jgi:hypothetical protein
MKKILTCILAIAAMSTFASSDIITCSIEGFGDYKGVISIDGEKNFVFAIEGLDSRDLYFKTKSELVFLDNADSTGTVEYYQQTTSGVLLATLQIDIDTRLHATGKGLYYFIDPDFGEIDVLNLYNCSGGHQILL